jgi:hypothetical protein
MGCKSGVRLTLKQAEEIRANQYRSSDNRTDYQPEEVDQRIIDIISRRDEKNTRRWTSQARKHQPTTPPCHLTLVANEEDSQEATDLPPTPEEEGIEDHELPPLFHGEEYLLLDNGFSLVTIPPTIMEF